MTSEQEKTALREFIAEEKQYITDAVQRLFHQMDGMVAVIEHKMERFEARVNEGNKE